MKKKLFITFSLLVITTCGVVIFLILTAPLSEEQFKVAMNPIYDSVNIGDYEWAENKIDALLSNFNLEDRHKRTLLRLSYSIYHQGGNLDSYEKTSHLIASQLNDQGFSDLFYIDALLQGGHYEKAINYGEAHLSNTVFGSIRAYLYKLADKMSISTKIEAPIELLSYTTENNVGSIQNLAEIMQSQSLLHNAAVKMIQDNFVDEAISQLEFLKLNQSKILLARLLLDKGLFWQAQKKLDSVEDMYKLDSSVLALYADIALETGDYDLLASIEDHIEQLSMSPRQESKLNRFYISLIQGDLDLIQFYAKDVLSLDTAEAYKALFRAVKQYPDLWDVGSLYERARFFKDPGVDLLYLELTKFQDTALIPRLWGYFWDFPEDTEVPRYLSYLLYRSGDYEELAVMLEKVPEEHYTSKWYVFFSIWLEKDSLSDEKLMAFTETSLPWYTNNLLASIALKKGYISTAEKLLIKAVNETTKIKTPRINAELQLNLAITSIHKNTFDHDYILNLLQASDQFISLRQRADKIKALLASR